MVWRNVGQSRLVRSEKDVGVTRENDRHVRNDGTHDDTYQYSSRAHETHKVVRLRDAYRLPDRHGGRAIAPCRGAARRWKIVGTEVVAEQDRIWREESDQLVLAYSV